MPQDSAVGRELHGEDSQWTVTDYLLAAAVDHLAAANWMFASVNTDEDSDPPEARSRCRGRVTATARRMRAGRLRRSRNPRARAGRS